MNPLEPPFPAPDPDLELASAYLDGELDADDRRRVESSPALLQLVASLRPASTALAQPVPTSGEARESAMAAAMDAFGAGAELEHPAAVSATQATVHQLASKRRRQWFGGAAAAAAVIAVVAAVGPFGSDDSDNQTASRSAESTAAASATTAVAAPAPPVGQGSDQQDTDGAGEAPSAAAPASEPKDDGVGASSEAAVISIDSPEQLLDLGPAIMASTPASTDGVAGATSLACVGEGTTLLAVIDYRGTRAVAVRDDLGVRRALDASTCAVLAEITEAP